MAQRIKMLNFLDIRTNGASKSVVFTGDGKLKVYVTRPLYDDKEDTSVSGDTLTTIGLLMFMYVPEGFVAGPSLPVYRLSIPMKISLTFSDSYTEKLKLSESMQKLEYMVFELTKGDMLIKDIFYAKDTNAMFRVLTKYVNGGKMPMNIRYDELLNVYLDIFKIYDTKIEIPAIVIEVVLSQLYRAKNNSSVPMRMVYDGVKVGPFDYRQIRLMKIPELESTFTGITATDVSHQLLSAVLRKKENLPEKESPIEKYMHY